MKKAVILFSLFCFLCAIPVVQAADTIFVRETRIPILIERQDMSYSISVWMLKRARP